MTSKAVYMIGDVDIKNIEEYKKYMEKVKPMIESYGGVSFFLLVQVIW